MPWRSIRFTGPEINDILDLSKVEAGRMELELGRFDLALALESALTLVRERAGRRGIRLALDLDERLESSVRWARTGAVRRARGSG